MPHLSTTLEKYGQHILACDVVRDPGSAEYEEIVKGYLAADARLRNWPRNQQHRRAVEKAIQALSDRNRGDEVDDEAEVLRLLRARKYLVLQGAPGTGKTHLAKLMAERLGVTEDHSVFTQFHAETGYSDFVWGIRPRLGRDDVAYEKTEGPLHRAICLARDHPQSPVLLIIDEINRANLATVLGPVFYLFEYQMAACGTVSLEVGPGLFVDRLLDLVQRSQHSHPSWDRRSYSGLSNHQRFSL